MSGSHYITGCFPARCKKPVTLPFPSKRLDYVNHARRLAEDDWTGMESENEEETKNEEEMDVDPSKKLPKRYANQVSRPGWVGAGSLRPSSLQPQPLNVAVGRDEAGMWKWNCAGHAVVQRVNGMDRGAGSTLLWPGRCHYGSLCSGLRMAGPCCVHWLPAGCRDSLTCGFIIKTVSLSLFKNVCLFLST